MLITGTLADGPLRYSDLAAAIPGISPRVPTLTLKHLQRSGLVSRTSGLAVARLSAARACRGRAAGLSCAVIVLASFGLRHFEDQPVAVHLCGHHPDAGANPRIRSNPYTTSLGRNRRGGSGQAHDLGSLPSPAVATGEDVAPARTRERYRTRSRQYS
nr:winged helix-turn-helix transcriptional regulator [Streptomyces sp. WAC00263]